LRTSAEGGPLYPQRAELAATWWAVRGVLHAAVSQLCVRLSPRRARPRRGHRRPTVRRAGLTITSRSRLVADVDGTLTVGVVPVSATLDLKALAPPWSWSDTTSSCSPTRSIESGPACRGERPAAALAVGRGRSLHVERAVRAVARAVALLALTGPQSVRARCRTVRTPHPVPGGSEPTAVDTHGSLPADRRTSAAPGLRDWREALPSTPHPSTPHPNRPEICARRHRPGGDAP
jgi:hypothetical protein